MTYHRAEAERLLDEATTLFQGPDYVAERAQKLAAAQVHATLACAPAVLEDERVAGVESQARDLDSDLRLLRKAARAVCESAGLPGPRMEVDGPKLSRLWTLIAEFPRDAEWAGAR